MNALLHTRGGGAALDILTGMCEYGVLNCPIHLIHLSLKMDPFPSISYSYIPVRDSRGASPGLHTIDG